MSLEEGNGPIEGDGYAIGSLDGIGQGYGFRKIRQALGVSEFGINAIVLPPELETGFHLHERQQELYFVHAGEVEIELGDGSTHRLGPGAMARVDASTHRKLKNVGDGDAVYVVIGAEGGYVGHDGIQPEGEERLRQSG